MKICKHCSSALADNVTFCPNCGCKLEENTMFQPTQMVITPPKKTNVCSLLAVIFGAIGIIPILNFLFLPVAIILAIIGLFISKSRRKGITIASVIVVIVSIIISIIWMFPFAPEKSDAENKNNTESTQSSTVESVEEEYQAITFADTVMTDFFQINIESICINKEIRPSVINGVYSYKEAETGKKYCFIKGTLKNTSGTSHQLSFLGNFIFDNNYTYSGILLKEVDNGIDNILMYETIQPLEEITFYYACCIPDETANNYNLGEVKFEVITDLYENSVDTKYNRYSLSYGK